MVHGGETGSDCIGNQDNDEGRDAAPLERRALNAADDLTYQVEDELVRRLALNFASAPAPHAIRTAPHDMEDGSGNGHETKRPRQPVTERSTGGSSSHRRYVVAQEPVRLAPINNRESNT
jgi:hypothetical protein